MNSELADKRAAAFVDGQNLFHAVKKSFGYTYPNYNVQALAEAVTRSAGWNLIQTRFYTGVPDPKINLSWSRFWTAKLSAMGRSGVIVVDRPLRYHKEEIRLADGTKTVILVGNEKGIDIRIALDVIHLGACPRFTV